MIQGVFRDALTYVCWMNKLQYDDVLCGPAELLKTLSLILKSQYIEVRLFIAMDQVNLHIINLSLLCEHDIRHPPHRS